MATAFYPSVASLITLDDLPQELKFIESGLSSVFEHVYFRDLQFVRSPKGESAFYSLVLVLKRETGFTIPGLEIKVLLNPDFDATGLTEIPVTLEYEWKLLALLKKVKKFTVVGFSFDAQSVFGLLSDISGITHTGLLEKTLEQFTNAPDPISAVNAFIDDCNAQYSTAVPHTTATTLGSALVEALDAVTTAANKPFYELIYEVYLENIGSPEEALENVKQLFASLFDIDPLEYLKQLLIPKINASLALTPAGLGIVFPRKYLTPLKTPSLEPYGDTGPEANVHSMLAFGLGTLRFSTESGFGYDENLTATLNHPSMIGSTGLIIDLHNAKLDLSKTKNIPEATLDGRPEDFVGVYIEEASITLPEKWFKNQDHTTAKIYGRKLLIGTGGLSGQIGLEATSTAPPPGSAPALVCKLGQNDGFEIGFEHFFLNFKQNAITASEIKGYIKIKGFKDATNQDARIDILVNIADNGDFSITASEEQGITLLKIPDILNVNIKSLSVGRKDNRFFVAVSGSIDFADQSANGSGSFIGDNLPKDIEIQKLLIWEDGAFEFEGGGIELRKPLSLKIKPVELTITKLHFGSHEQQHGGQLRKYKFFGFDGGVSIKPGGIDAQGDGVKFYFTVDVGPDKPMHVFMRIQSIAISIIIPGEAKPEQAAVLLKGYLSMKSPSDANAANADAGTEYAGGIDLTLPKLKIAGSASMRMNPSVPAFVVDIGLELPAPILLGTTGLGIYALRGLLGARYVANREYVGLPADAEWYQYYKKKVAPENREGIFIGKMKQEEGFSIGAGVSLCTAADSGRTFSAKIFFLLSLPEVFLLQGQGAFLHERIGLDDPNDPPFFALIAISSTSIETALGVNYKMPDSGDKMGKIVTLDGIAELAFFWGNAFSWYLNIGRDMPEERRIRARIFDLFDAYFFLMISSEGIYTGAGASYNLDKKYGPVRVHLSAYLDTRGKISFKPLQIGASIQLGASIEISVFGCGFGISADAGLAAEAPKPFIISGFISVGFKILWKTFKFNIDFTWTFSTQLDTTELLIVDSDLANAVKAINAQTKEAYKIFAQKLVSTGAAWPAVPWAAIEDFTIPQDCFVDIEFKQGVHATGADTSLVNFNDINSGFEYWALVPPQKGKSKQVKHEFFVDKAELKCWNPQTSTWEDYHPYKAMTPLADLPHLDISPYATFDAYVDAKGLKFGSWQLRQPNKYNMLRVLATNPLSYMTQGMPFTPEELQITSSTIFCQDPPRPEVCVLPVQLGRKNEVDIPYVPANQNLALNGIMFRLVGENGEPVNNSFNGINGALRFFTGTKLEIYLPEKASRVSLLLQMNTANAKIEYFKRAQIGVNSSQVPVYGFQLVSAAVVAPMQALQPIVYDHLNTPIDKVIITPGKCSGGKYTCAELPENINKLLNLLNMMVRANRFGNPRPINISSGKYADDFAELIKQPLFGNYKPGLKLFIDANYNKDNTLYIRIYVGKLVLCEIKIAPVEKLSFNLQAVRLIRFENLRPDDEQTQNGLNYGFWVDMVVFADGRLQTIACKGKSTCIAVKKCVPNEKDPRDIVLGVQYESFLKSLNMLAKNKRLVQTRKLNIVSGKYSPEFKPILEYGLFFKAGKLFYEAEQVDSNDISIYFYNNQGKETIQLETAYDAKEPMNFSAVTGFGELRPAPDTQTGGKKYSFLIDAYSVRNGIQQKTTLAGSTSFAVFSDKAAATGNGLTCKDNIEVMSALERFFDALRKRQHLVSSEPVFLNEFPWYTGAYFLTVLFPQGAEPKLTTWQLTCELNGFKQIFATLTNVIDKQSVSCSFELEIIDKNLHTNFKQLEAVINLKPDPAFAAVGENVHFVATGIFNTPAGPVEAAIRGMSCYVITVCEKPRCSVDLYRLCYLPQEDGLYNATIPAITTVQQNNQAMMEAMNKLLQPVWRPQTVFGIRIHTRDELSADGSPLASYSNAYFFGFKTAGPPGHFHEYNTFLNATAKRPDFQALEQKDKEDEFKQLNLKFYVDLDKSYPNADGRMTNAKPLFYRNPKLSLLFVENYVYNMYNDWGVYRGNVAWNIKLDMYIIDPAYSADNPTVFDLNAEWEKTETPYHNIDVQVLDSFIQSGAICTQVDEVDTYGMNVAYTVPELKPLKTYAAQFLAGFKRTTQISFKRREVHRYVFATSRYPDFAAQVNSYILFSQTGSPDKLALFNLPLTLTAADIGTAVSVLNGTSPDALNQQFMNPYDRLIDGALKIPAMEAAICTEFNVVREQATNRILGILIRNPEPFNDPKIPETILNSKRIVELSINGGPSNLFKCVYFKDLSRIFITNANNSMNMPAGTYSFTLRYLEFSRAANDYIVAGSISGIQLTIS